MFDLFSICFRWHSSRSKSKRCIVFPNDKSLVWERPRSSQHDSGEEVDQVIILPYLRQLPAHRHAQRRCPSKMPWTTSFLPLSAYKAPVKISWVVVVFKPFLSLSFSHGLGLGLGFGVRSHLWTLQIHLGSRGRFIKHRLWLHDLGQKSHLSMWRKK